MLLTTQRDDAFKAAEKASGLSTGEKILWLVVGSAAGVFTYGVC